MKKTLLFLKTNLSVVRILFSVLIMGFFFNQQIVIKNNYDDKRMAFEKFIKEHPYSNHDIAFENEGEKNENNDRPDLAWQQNFLMTLDPKLGYPPTERLVAAREKVYRYKNRRTSIPGISWTERGPNNVGGRTRALMFDPNDASKKKVWAGGVDGGLWYNDDITTEGSSWSKVDDFWDNIAITTIVFNPGDKSKFYVGTGEGWSNLDAVRGAGIWKSSDGGATWAQLASTTGSDFYYVQKILVHPKTGDIYAATKTGGVMRSKDGGASWIKVLGSGVGASTSTVADIEIAANDSLFVAMGIQTSSGGIYKSPSGDAGSWTKLGGGLPTSGIERMEIAVALSDASRIYVLTQDASTNEVEGIYRSSNGGTSWTPVTVPTDAVSGDNFARNQAWYDLIAAVSPSDKDELWIGGVDLFKSTDGGDSWTQVSHWYGGGGFPEVHADQHAIVFRPGLSANMIFGNDGGVFYSSDAGSFSPSFTTMNTDYNITQFYSCAINPLSGSNQFLAGSQDNGTHRFTSTGLNATTEVRGGDGGFCFIDQSDAKYQISAYVYNTFRRSSDTGKTFSTILVDDQSSGRFINPGAYDSKEKILYSAYSDTKIFRIKSVTGTPDTASLTIAGLGSIASHFRVSPYSAAGKSTVFVGTTSGKLFKVTEAQSAVPTITDITSASFDFGNISCVDIGANDGELLVVFSNFGVTSVWYTSDGGTSWSDKEGNLPDMPVRSALFNPNDRKQVLLATEVGVWSTTDISGSSPDWSPSNSGLANVRVDMLQLRNSDYMVIAATHGRGLFSTDIFTTPPALSTFFTANKTSICGGDTVSFTDQSTGSPTSWQWTFTGGTPSSSTTQNPKVKYSSAGTFAVKLKVTNISGSDSLTKTSYISVGGQSLPFSEGFESSTFVPSGWTLENPNNDSTWRRTTDASGFGTSTACMMKNNASSNDAGNLDSLITTPLKFSGFTSVTLTFDVAYARYSSIYSDTLIVAYSTDCGTSFTQVYKKGGTDLATHSDLSSGFIPVSGDWRTETIDLDVIAGIDNVKIALINKSGWGNNLYLDNINISGSGGAKPVAKFSADDTTVCVGTMVNFTDLSTNTPTSWSWTFTGGSPSISSAQNPSVSYPFSGTYSVKLRATNGNGSDSLIKTGYITIYPNPSASITSHIDVKCYGGATGSLTASGSGGTSPYTYKWSNSPTLAKDSNLVAGIYTVTITDKKGCAATKKDTIIQPASQLSASITSHIDVKCNGVATGSLTASGSGGTSPYTYKWSNSPTSAKDSNLIAGIYTVTVTDKNGCTATKKDTITQPATPLSANITSHIDIKCYGDATGSLTASGSGGTSPYTYKWSNSPTSAKDSNLIAGIYTVTVTDKNGCTTTKKDTITQPATPLSANITSHIDVKCYGGATGSLTASGSGGTSPYTFKWSNNPISAKDSNLVAGIYTVTITDKNGCTATKKDTITQSSELILTTSIAPDTCGKGVGTATVVATGGTPVYSYNWSSGAATVMASGLVAGNYTVTVTDSKSCTKTSSTNITEFSGPSIASTKVNASCFGDSSGSVNLTVTGGTSPYSYLWSNGKITKNISGLKAGVYTVTVTDLKNCTETQSDTITQPNALVLVMDSTDDNGTNNGTAKVTASGGTPGYTYKWNTNPVQTNATATGLASGIYKVVVTDSKGCKDSATVKVNLNVGINGIIASEKMYLYPNPFQGIINLGFEFSDHENLSIEIRDIEGRIIYSDNHFSVKKQELAVDLSGTTSGIYFLKILTSKEIWVRKIVLTK